MKRFTGFFAGLLLLVLVLIGSAFAQTPQGSAASREDLKKLPGYVDLDSIGIFKGVKPKVEVFLDGPMLRFVAAATSDFQNEAAELIPSLKMMRVQVYENKAEETRKVFDKVAGLVADLKNKHGWYPVVSVPDEKEKVDILTKIEDNRIKGFALLVVNQKEVVLINIAGDMDPEKFGKQVGSLAGKFLQGKMDMSQFGKLLEANVTPGEPEFIVTGTVKDAVTGDPIEGARVSDDKYGKKPYKGADTGPDGKYSYGTWPEEHNIFAWAPGYKPQKKTITTNLPQDQEELTLNFELTPE